MNVPSLFDSFERARHEAMALTDRYAELTPDHPDRTAVWDQAMQHTEHARQLLEAWLRTERPPTAAAEHELALA